MYQYEVLFVHACDPSRDAFLTVQTLSRHRRPSVHSRRSSRRSRSRARLRIRTPMRMRMCSCSLPVGTTQMSAELTLPAALDRRRLPSRVSRSATYRNTRSLLQTRHMAHPLLDRTSPPLPWHLWSTVGEASPLLLCEQRAWRSGSPRTKRAAAVGSCNVR